MKHSHTFQRPKNFDAFFNGHLKITWRFLLLFLLSTALSRAQNSALFLTWDSEVGCQISGNDRDLKTYFELIEDGECLQVCQNTTAFYTLHGYEANWQSVQWDVAGGIINGITINQTVCEVQWGSGIVGSIGAIITTTNGTRILADLCVEIIKKPRA